MAGCYNLTLQEESEKTGKVTSTGLYFLHFQVYRMDSSVNEVAMAKDPEAAFYKRLEGLQPCEVSELKVETHIFAVYGFGTIPRSVKLIQPRKTECCSINLVRVIVL